jgi:hypothetical protein
VNRISSGIVVPVKFSAAGVRTIVPPGEDLACAKLPTILYPAFPSYQAADAGPVGFSNLMRFS